MRSLLFILFTCACIVSQAQVNYVQNPSLEEYWKCPTTINQIFFSKNWLNAIDSDFFGGMEYNNSCAGSTPTVGVPNNINFYQTANTGNGLGGFHLYYDGTSPYPPAPLPESYRDYLQGHLQKSLTAGKSYCVKFYLNLAEASGYAHNKIGAYLDDGSFDDTVSVPGSAMTFVTPQVYTEAVIDDTANWTKVEGAFVAKGTETYITLGNFFNNSAITTKVTNYWHIHTQYSYYLIDDISVIETDLPANAGPDVHTIIGDSVWIGRSLDSAFGLECKWYKNGLLLPGDSVAGLWAKGIVKGVDTYVVVQTICGTVKTDTALVYTFPVGMQEWPGIADQSYSIFPNPVTGGQLHIKQFVADHNPLQLLLSDMSGRVLLKSIVQFSSKQAVLDLLVINPGVYLLQLQDGQGIRYFQQVIIE